MDFISAKISRFLQYLPCRCRGKTLTDNRTVYVGNKIPSGVNASDVEKFRNNKITSSKYTVWNFVPKNLFEQFHRVANFYFLIVAIVQLCIDSPVSPYTSILPLTFVISIAAIKQGYEDWQRHKADREVNHREAFVVRDGVLHPIRSAEIQVGDIVRVTSNSHIPCDLVLLSSNSPDGKCFITSANLDGETSIKTFVSVTRTQHLRTDESFGSLEAIIECQLPNSDLYRFVGLVRVRDEAAGETTWTVEALNPESVLLTGCSLKNTKYIYGCAIYTGEQTKMFLNSKYKSHKYSRVERKLNYFLRIYLFLLLLYSAIWVGIALSYYHYRELPYVPIHLAKEFWQYHETKSGKADSFVQLFLGFMVLCNYVIPISMYVSIEFQKFCGSRFFNWDLLMYNPKTDEPAKAMTSDLNEELGQVEYLFSDKTGTLTENKMEFRMCSAGGAIYLEMDGRLCRKADIFNTLPLPQSVDDLLLPLALCHTVRVETHDLTVADSNDDVAVVSGNAVVDNGSRDTSGSQSEYHSSSPDEKALVEACKRFGFVFNGMEDRQMLLSVHERPVEFTLEHVLEFDPVRKRMSVIVRDIRGAIFLFTKGADVSMFERIRNGDVLLLESHINEFSKLGLRTLVIGCRRIPDDVFDSYDLALRQARQAMESREEKLSVIFNEIETNLELLGATAVEDKLQDDVPGTLMALRKAGIKVWVLTGDKEETATNISFSAGHFNHRMRFMHVTRKTNSEDCGTALQSLSNRVDACDEDENETHQQHALIIDGVSLAFMIEDHQDLLRDLCERCAAVLCCRLTPIQKAQVVRLMKNGKKNPTTAAIGDGANDVSMIQEAHVGMGIMGKEGRQAVQSSDYAFSQFKYLKRVLLLHGHYFYVRTSTLVQYFFYKNVAMIMCQFYYTFYTAYSAQVLYDAFFLTLYNSVFTSIPIIIYGLFEQNVRASYLLENPECYRMIRRNKRLSNWNFVKWTVTGVWHSFVLFFGAYFALARGNSPFRHGQTYGNYDFGVVVMTACVITVNTKLLLESYFISGFLIVSYVCVISAYFVVTLFYSSIILPFPGAMTLHGSMVTMLSSPYIWLLIILQVVTALLPDAITRAFRDSFGVLYRRKRPLKKSNYDNSMATLVSLTLSSSSVNISRLETHENAGYNDSDASNRIC